VGNPTWIGINSTHSIQRQRFTVAHEIGHFLLHSTDRVHVDKRYEIKRRDNKSKEGTDVEEMESNLFAAELLMPADFLIRDLSEMKSIDLSDENALKQIAKHYQVSTQALAVRLTALGFV
jgi:Zn-dependent peptidase ImmA (M78 family)